MNDRDIFRRIVFAINCLNTGRVKADQTGRISEDQLLDAWDNMGRNGFNEQVIGGLAGLIAQMQPGDQAIMVVRKKGKQNIVEGQPVSQFGFGVNVGMTAEACLDLLMQGIKLVNERARYDSGPMGSQGG
jgi:hypothetical protein